jgi:hypothetical protein
MYKKKKGEMCFFFPLLFLLLSHIFIICMYMCVWICDEEGRRKKEEETYKTQKKKCNYI